MEKPVAEMNKDELEEYAIANHGVEIDKRRKLDDLRAEVAKLDADKKEPTKAVSVPDAVHPGYLKHAVNGRVYKATKELIARGDMIPCDAKGNHA